MPILPLTIWTAAFWISDGARVTTGASDKQNVVAGTTTVNLCDSWLSVQYKGSPEIDAASPVTGSFYLKPGEWNDAVLYRKDGNSGCDKTYVAKCAIGSMEVTEVCAGEKKATTRTKCIGGWSCLRSSYETQNKNEDEIMVQHPAEGPLKLVAGVVTTRVVRNTAVNSGQCLPMQTQKNFNLNSYIAKPWFIQQQMPTQYLPVEKNFCVAAKYTLLPKKSFWGYTIQVRNIARTAEGNLSDSGELLLAYSADSVDPAKLGVAPYFVPKSGSGDYWVVAYDEEEGYAIISGGQPSHKTEGGCTTGDGTNDSGFWLFTRQRKRDKALVEKMRSVAQAKGFDVGVLRDVDQSDCADMPVL